MVRVARIHPNQPDPTKFLDEEYHLVGSFRYVCFEHQGFFNFVKKSLGFVKRRSVDTYYVIQL